jgi:hypothetical protein
MRKEVSIKVAIVLLLVISMISLFAIGGLATEFCFEDSDCFDALGEDYVCDLELYECVQIDSLDSSNDDGLTEADKESCMDEIDNDEDGFIDGDDPDCLDSDEDGVFDGVDECEGFDDNIDDDLNGIADGCDDADNKSSDDSLSESEVNAEISDLDNRVTTIETNVAEMTTSIDDLTNSVDDLNTNVELLVNNQEQLEKEVESQVNTIESQVVTGLAGLQEDIETTQSELAGTQEEVKESAAKASFFRTISIIIVLAIIISAIGFFLKTHQQEEEKELTIEVKNFITSQIKNGLNENQIISALQKSGWQEHDAKWAYEHTKVNNYNQFLISQGKKTKELPKHKPKPEHYKKIAMISIVSLVIMGVMLFFVKQSVGFAVYDDYSESLDENSSEAEDITDSLDESTTSTGEDNEEDSSTNSQISCNMNSDCTANNKEYCVEGSCMDLLEIYDTEGSCSNKCNFDYIKMSTSDDETYYLSRGEGSYTAVGAIEWKILNSQDYCQSDSQTKVALEIIKKKPGEIVSKEVILLNSGESSDSISHNDISSIDFKLKVDSFTETCS